MNKNNKTKITRETRIHNRNIIFQKLIQKLHKKQEFNACEIENNIIKNIDNILSHI